MIWIESTHNQEEETDINDKQMPFRNTNKNLIVLSTRQLLIPLQLTLIFFLHYFHSGSFLFLSIFLCISFSF